MELSQDKRNLLASLLSLSSCTVFYSMNTTLNYITLPIMLMGRAPSSPSDQGRFLIPSSSTPVSSSSHLLRQWQEVYWRGHRVGPASSIFSGVTAFYAAYHSAPASIKQGLYIAAGCWAMAAWPFTIFVMVPTNDELHRRGNLVTEGMREGKKGGEGVDGKETMELLKYWTLLSKVRASLAMVAAVCVVGALMV